MGVSALVIGGPAGSVHGRGDGGKMRPIRIIPGWNGDVGDVRFGTGTTAGARARGESEEASTVFLMRYSHL